MMVAPPLLSLLVFLNLDCPVHAQSLDVQIILARAMNRISGLIAGLIGVIGHEVLGCPVTGIECHGEQVGGGIGGCVGPDDMRAIGQVQRVRLGVPAAAIGFDSDIRLRLGRCRGLGGGMRSTRGAMRLRA